MIIKVNQTHLKNPIITIKITIITAGKLTNRFENSINETMHNVIYIMNQMDNRDKSWKKLNKISQMLADKHTYCRII